MNINEILGDYDTRYFGAGHKNTEYLIKDIHEKAKEQIKTNREAVSKKIIEQYHEPTLKEKIKLMTKY